MPRKCFCREPSRCFLSEHLMNHVLFNKPDPDPNKAPHLRLLGSASSEVDHGRGYPLRFSVPAVSNPQFHAHRVQEQQEFQCDRCGGPVARMRGRRGTDQLPPVMYWNNCSFTSGGWLTNQERETFLKATTIT